jgi:RecJ-like exonuclease
MNMEGTLGEMAQKREEMLVQDELTKKLKPKIMQVAKLFRDAFEKRRFILLRFHHDADGIASAFALSEIIRFSPYQQNSAAYSAKDAIRDLSNITHEENPLVVIVDFGLNSESVEGLKLLKAAGVEVVVIDHHPPSTEAMGIPDVVLTPWEFAKGDVSHYVAGYLCSEIAWEMGFDCAEYARISCAGDKSELMGLDLEDKKKALVLDYLAAHSGYGNNLRFYKQVLSKKELFDSMWLAANEKIDEAASNVPMKEKDVGEIKVFTLDLEKVVTKGEFPNRSKVTTRVFEKLNSEKPLIVLGLGERTVILRINQAAADKGISANTIAKKIQETMPDFVESGGGHKKAGAIRVKVGFVESVKNGIIRLLES